MRNSDIVIAQDLLVTRSALLLLRHLEDAPADTLFSLHLPLARCSLGSKIPTHIFFGTLVPMVNSRAPFLIALLDQGHGSGATMEPLDYWRLCDDLSVVQAALLIVGEDPSDYIDHWPAEKRSRGYDAAKAALVNEIKAKRLSANIVEIRGDLDWPTGELDWDRTTISVESLRAWLRSRGIKTGFFFPAPEAGPDYLSASHPNYSAKLAAAIEAWRAISSDAELRRGKSVKQALMIWLREHANKFGLTKEDGNPNEQGIEDVAKIANWDTKGGAPKTPGNE